MKGQAIDRESDMPPRSVAFTAVLESLSATARKLHEIDDTCLNEGAIEPLRRSMLYLLSAQASLLRLVVDRMTGNGEIHAGSVSPPPSEKCRQCRIVGGSPHNPYRPSRARSG